MRATAAKATDYSTDSLTVADGRRVLGARLSDDRPWAGRAGGAAVLSMTLCVMVLIASEFMPVSLLTPIAGELAITEGQAGQAISISGVFAVITSLFIASATARLDRRATTRARSS